MKVLKSFFILLFALIALFGCELNNQVNEIQTTVPVDNSGTTIADSGRYFVFDDMVFDRAEASHQYFIDVLSGKTEWSEQSRGLKQNSVTLWPNGTVYYYYGNTFTATEKATVTSAMKSISLVCNVRFIETTAGTYRYKISKITNPDIGGQSTLGYIQYPFCDLTSVSYGTAMHEFIHGLGISHEHNRYDRPVTINTANINPTYLSQFNIVPSTSGAVYYEYDYDSIMHYGAYAFSINGLKTIEAGSNAIGQRNHLSVNDKRTLLTLYPYPSSKQFRLKNRWTGLYMHIENKYGWVQMSTVPSYWLSAKWIIECNRGFMRFKNVWTGQYMHNEANSYYVQVGAVEPYWWSAEWIPVEHDGAIRLQNRWTSNYAHTENQYTWLQLGAIQSSWISCDWIFEVVN